MALNTTTASAEDLRGLDNPTLALNLSGVRDYRPGLQFLDIMKMAREWIGHEPGQWGGTSADDLEVGGYLDENGWPTEIPEGVEKIGTIWQWSDHSESVDRREGVYVVDYEGEGDLRISGDVTMLPSEPGQLKFQAYGGNIYLNIQDTDPSGTGNHLRDISIVKEENLPLYEAGAVFNPDWLALIEDARELRFMDWIGTNNSDVVSWDQRPTPDGGPSGGVALEHMVQLANEVGADPWFTMPHQADAEYIRNFATYVRDNLDPSLTAKVEYSNEVWNFAFEQTRWLYDKAAEDWGVEGGPGFIDYHAKKAVETALIWQDVFGEETDARLSNVIGTQAGNPWVTQRLMNPEHWRENEPDTYVDPKGVFDEVALTTYFGGSAIGREDYRDELLAAIKDPQVDAAAYLYEKMRDPDYNSSIPDTAQHLGDQKAVADQFGLKMTAYEGGQHLHHSFAVKGLTDTDVAILSDFMAEFVNTPEMADLYAESWESWAEVSDGAYMQFGDMTKPSKWGSWGIYESLDTTTLRGDVLNELNASETPWWDTEGGEHYQQGVTTKGTAEADLLVGTSQEDYLLGGDGDDVFVAGGGNDGINGGDGVDRAVFEGPAAAYTLVAEGEGYRVTGPDGSDFLIHVEELQFGEEEVVRLEALIEANDGTLILPSTPTEETDEAALEDDIPDLEVGKSPDLISSPEQAEFVEALPESEPMAELLDPDARGLEISSVNRWSELGAALGMGEVDAVYVASLKDASIEIGGQTVTANYWTVNEGRLSRDGEKLGDALDVAQSLGTLIEGNPVIMGAGDDRFMGRDEANAVYARAGNDYLDGRGGADTLDGGDGQDVIVGGKGDDILIGGAGADRFVARVGDGADRISDYDGDDILDLTGYRFAGQSFEDMISYTDEGMVISNGSDSLILEGIGAEDAVRVKGPGGTTVLGGPTDASLVFTVDDTDGVGVQIDSLNRWSETGKALGLNVSCKGAYTVVETGATAEIDGQSVSANYWTLNEGKTARDGIYLGDGLDVAKALGTVVADTNSFVMGSGNDRFLGRDEDSSVNAGAGNDFLSGGGGADTLEGGTGNDVLVGGTGADTFVFRAGDGQDRVKDFSEGDQLILNDYLNDGQTVADVLIHDGTTATLSNGTDTITFENIAEEELDWFRDEALVA